MELVRVGEVMTADFHAVPHTATLPELRRQFDQTRHHGFPVLDDQGLLFGIVTLSDLGRATKRDLPVSTTVAEIATCKLIVVYADQSLNTAMRKFALHDVGRIPVIDRENPRKLLGLVRRNDIVKGYQLGMLQRDKLEQREQHMRLSNQSGTEVLELMLPEQSGCADRAVRDLGLPPGVIITSILRDGETIIPSGDTVLQPGDHLTVLAKPEQIKDVRALLEYGVGDACALHYHVITLHYDAPVVGKSVATLGLPPDVLIVTLRRQGNTETVHGGTQLEAGDELTLISEGTDWQTVQQHLTGMHDPHQPM
jgi:CIC family chloride channel protein